MVKLLIVGILLGDLALLAKSPNKIENTESPKNPLPEKENSELSGKSLFEAHCKVCHSLALPRNQRLSRQDWQWVVNDMKKKYGMTWVTKKQREKIINYLATHFGAKKKKKVW